MVNIMIEGLQEVDTRTIRVLLEWDLDYELAVPSELKVLAISPHWGKGDYLSLVVSAPAGLSDEMVADRIMQEQDKEIRGWHRDDDGTYYYLGVVSAWEV